MPLHTCSTMVHIYDYQLSSLLSIITILILKSRCTVELSVTWDLIFCLTAGALKPQKQHLFSWFVFSFPGNSSVLRSYLRGEALPKSALSTMLACFLVYRSIPCLRHTHIQLEGRTIMFLLNWLNFAMNVVEKKPLLFYAKQHILLFPSQIYLMTPLNCLTVENLSPSWVAIEFFCLVILPKTVYYILFFWVKNDLKVSLLQAAAPLGICCHVAARWASLSETCWGWHRFFWVLRLGHSSCRASHCRHFDHPDVWSLAYRTTLIDTVHGFTMGVWAKVGRMTDF